MPAETIICNICKKEVSKRKSLNFHGGRACRDHEEVIKMVEEQKMHECTKKAIRIMKKINAVSFVRAFHTLRGVPVCILLEHVRRKCNNEEYKAIVAELDKRGYEMSDDEILTSMVMYGDLLKRNEQVLKVVEESNANEINQSAQESSPQLV